MSKKENIKDSLQAVAFSLSIITIAAFLFAMMTGFSFSQEESRVESKEFIFVEKSKDYSELVFILENQDDESYYIIPVDSYQYDNKDLKSGDILELDSKDINVGFISHIIRELSPKQMPTELTNKEVKFDDEWINLFKLKRFTKDN